MPETIFNPKDSSLEARIKAYRSVVNAWYNSEASIKAMEDDEWAYTLGEREEVVKANDLIINSLKQATKQISQKEINQARKIGLLSESEAKEFINNTRQEEIKKIRKNRQKSGISKDRER